jgi:hypothetical protein
LIVIGPAARAEEAEDVFEIEARLATILRNGFTALCLDIRAWYFG